MSAASKDRTGSASGNRRAHRRAELRARVALCCESGPLSGVAFDVSPVGLGVQLEQELDLGAFVSVVFALPSGVVIDAQAHVARHAPPTLGLKFHGLRQEDRRELSAYCETWRRDLLERCSQRRGFARKPRVVVPDSTSPSPVLEAPQSSDADSTVRVKISPIIDVSDD